MHTAHDSGLQAGGVARVMRVIWILFLFLFLTGGFGDPGRVAADASHCEIATGRVALDGGTLHYTVAGTGPWVLLLHGLFAQKEQWNDLLCRLSAAGYTALAPDLPGYGQSVAFPLPDYALARQVVLLHQLTETLNITRLDLAGNSMGGAIAALYVRQYPQQVRTLAFLGAPFGLIEWSPSVKAAIADGINPFVPMDIAQFELEMRLLFVHPPSIPAAVKDELVKGYVERHRFYQQVWNIVNLDARVLDQTAMTGQPTFILWGREDRIFAMEEGVKPVLRQFPRAWLVKPANTGHLPHLENAAATADQYLDFLRTTQEGISD